MSGKKSPDERLFLPATPADEIRAILRTHGRMSDEEIDALAPDALTMALFEVTSRVEADRDARARLDADVASGRLLPHDAERMTPEERRSYHRAAIHIDAFRRALGAPATGIAPSARPEVDTISRTEVLSLFGQALAIMASQETHIAELRTELAEAKNAHLAAFGKHALVDQIIKAERDIEGFEVTIELEEQASSRSEVESSSETDETSAVADARETRAAIGGLAQHVAGLDIGRKVNFDDLNKATARMRERAVHASKVRSRGRVEMKFGKVSGGKRSPTE